MGTEELPGAMQQTALASLRLAFPACALGFLALRWLGKAMIGGMSRIQAGDWVPPEDEELPPSPTGPEDEVLPVVVKRKDVRRTLVYLLFAFVAASVCAQGILQVVATVWFKHYTPDLPLFENYVPYILGGVATYGLYPLAMSFEEGWASKPGQWWKIAPLALSVVALAMDAAVLALESQLFASDEVYRLPVPAIAATDIGLVAFRVLLLVLLLLSQTPLLYKTTFIPAAGAATEVAGEQAGLLANGNGSNGTGGYGATSDGGKKADGTFRYALRSSRPPRNRPEDPKDVSIMTLLKRVKVLFPYLWPSESLALQILAIICITIMFLQRAINILVPVMFGRVIQNISDGEPPFVNIILYIAVGIVRDSGSMLRAYLWFPIEQFSEREMEMMSFDALLNLSLAYHTRRKTGELLRVLDRSEAINDFFETLLFTFLPILIDVPVAFVYIIIRYGPLIATISIGVALVYATTSFSMARSRVKLSRAVRDENQFMRQIKTDTLFNWETVKIFTTEQFESSRLRNALRMYQKRYFQLWSAWNSLTLIQTLISQLGLLVCLFILAYRVASGSMAVGAFATFTTFLWQLYNPLNSVASLYRKVMTGLVDTEQLMDLLKEEKDIVDRPNPIELTSGDGDIVFDNVKFSYDKKVDAIKGISFTVKAGQTVAIVGPSGAGKSSIMRLIYRFYDVTEGSISIGGTDIRDYSQHSLRRNIGLVPQDSVLFNETVRYNIGYGNIDTSEEDIYAAAEAANMHERILSFPDKYETRVGERGQRLSGGEKQRVAIARVLLKNPPILLLDEATSALDTHNERAIQNRLKDLSVGRTVISIAHRLSTIIDSDVIFVLSEGQIAESGSHLELLEKGPGGVYNELWQKQIQADDEAKAAQPESALLKRVANGSADTTAAPSRTGTPIPTGLPKI